MTIAISSNQTISNAGSSGGVQSDAKVAQLTGGGYVVAWTSSVPGDPNGGNAVYRLFDANGNPTSAIQQASTQITNNEVMQDIIANTDGTFTIAFTATGPGGAAPVGYGATGIMEKIGVLRNFNSGGTALGLETKVFVNLVHDNVDSMKLVNASATSNFVYFTQSDAGDSFGNLYKSPAVSTIGPGTVITGVILKSTSGIAAIDDVSSHSPTSDFILVDDLGFFSDNPTPSFSDPLVAGFAKVTNDVSLRFFLNFTDGSLIAESYSGIGNNITTYALMGSITLPIPGATSTAFDSVDDVRTESLGGGRFLVAFSASNLATAPSGVYGVVFNANTMGFEGSPSLMLEGNFTIGEIGMDVLADGRVALTHFNNFGFAGGYEVTTRIVDPRDAEINADTSSLFGSVGNDSISLAHDTVGFRIDLSSPVFNSGLAAIVTGTFNNVIGGSGADQIYGDADINFLKGGGGDDVIDGRANNDLLSGGLGSDTISGGSGNDLIDGGIGLDAISGGAGIDVIMGGDDDDVIYGGSDDDQLDGGNADDSIYGGTGNDTIDGGVGNDRLFGAAGDDIIFGNSGSDLIYDQDGDDTVDAGSGNDIVAAGAGTDVLNGGSNVDTVSYAARIIDVLNPGFVIDLEEAFDFEFTINPDAVREDVLIGFESATGSAGADVIVGNVGTNILRGGAGDDLIYSRGGADTIFTGIGADRIYIAASNEGADLVKDYQQGVDKILIVSSAFGDLNESNIAAQFTANATGTAAANGSPQFTFDNSGAGAGDLRFDADGNGAGAAVVIGRLTFNTATGLATFGAADFDFV
jgi:RTX calcium-binding nonapeptide repeat (4 copies)